MIDGHVHVIAGLAVCSRAADVWTTHLVTPTLKLEANPIARRFGWKLALLTILVGLVAYASPHTPNSVFCFRSPAGGARL